MICKSEFTQMSQHESVMETLGKLQINHLQFQKYAELLFAPKKEGGETPVLNYDESIQMILRLRPGQHVNCCDFEHFKFILEHGNKEIALWIADIEDILEAENVLDKNSKEPTAGQSIMDNLGPPTIERLAL